MKKHLSTRLLSLLLVVAMLAGFAVPVQAHDHTHEAADESESLAFTELENSTSLELLNEASETEEEPLYADSDTVRVSIVLDSESTIEAGFTTENISANTEAMAYRDSLKAEQEIMTTGIEAAIGEELDVVWNLTLVANVISANVEYGQIAEIEAVPGVKEVFLETRYEPAVVDQEEAYDPNMATSGSQIGSNVAWANGYTGAGSRVAIIDTGVDTDHQSMSSAAFDYSLAQNAAAEGLDTETYVSGLDLLDAEEIASVRDQLHVGAGFTAESLYVNSKIAFGYNYIDEDLDIVHDNDSQGSHGSHVSGIAAANTYIPNGDGTYAKALDSVFVQGVAPDAQLVVMKVFGKAGGAYDTDYMVAIEDAIILGCDAVNLSLGSASHGFVTSSGYEELLDALTRSGTVAVMSAGNNGYWAEDTKSPAALPYADDINFYTGGSPGSYTNSLGVASVQNAGQTGYYVQVGDSRIYYNGYTKEEWSNEPMTAVAGDQEYVFIDGLGTPEEWAAVGDALVGKIAICSRGTISFFQKAINAVEAGAIATIIYNNTSGTINMDLTDYTKSAPCVSITQEEGALIKSLSTPVTDDAGNVLYYTGKMYVANSLGTVIDSNEYYTMSSFSSWGVPTALILKPEITAPGGNIYSLNGLDASGKAYENNSGTSMSAPQVTGMTAVVAEYIRETGLEAKTGLSVRQLAQSLLMSTAVPLKEEASGGNYYSVLNQGSGLANVGAAVTAGSYILMNADATESYADGKVKAELGDDPERKGEYTFSFTLNNFSDSGKTYTLGADIFTQDTAVSNGIVYLDTWTTPIAAKVTYLVDGVEFVPVSKVACDLDQDGDTDADDAQIVLNYAVGQISQIDAIADVNGDGATNTYDAYLILASMNTSEIAVAAGSKVNVSVKITLSDAVKAALDAEYVNGAYIEGYVFVEPTATSEGVIADVTHSIPVLGFYGNWTDASMYEKNTYAERLYGDTTPTYFDPAAQYSGVEDTNSLTVKFADDANTYYMVGNPYFTEETYPAERMAVSNSTTLKSYKVTLIRNAAALATFVTNENGDVIYVSTPTANVYGAYYYTSGAAWRNTSTTAGINKTVEKLGVEEGERITVGVVAIPEYYAQNGNLTAEDVQNLIQDDVLGDGAYLTTSMMVDNTAPVVTDISKSLVSNKLTITAQDENYLAAVQVTNLTGSVVYASGNPMQEEKGEEVSVVVDLNGVQTSKKYLVTVADYAGNRATFEVSAATEEVDYTGQMFAWTRSGLRRTEEEKAGGVASTRWMKVDPDTLWYDKNSGAFTGTENYISTDYAAQLNLNSANVLTGDYVEGFVVFAMSDGSIYSAPLDDLNTITCLANWSDVVAEHGGSNIFAMHLNYADGYMYLLDDQENFYRFNLHTCELEYVFTVTLYNPNTASAAYDKLYDFAIHKDGTFYALNRGAWSKSLFLYKFTMDDVQTYENEDGTTFTGIQDLEPVFNDKNSHLGFSGAWNPTQMFWDHDKEILYMVRNSTSNSIATDKSILYTIDLNTGLAVVANEYVPEGVEGGVSALFCNYVYSVFVVPAGDSLLLPGNQASEVIVSAPRTDVLVTASMQFSAEVGPWNLNDKSVTWSSSDESIATIDANGVATFHKVGTVTITATSVAKPHVQGTCDVNVVTYPSTTLSAAVTGTDGVTHVAEFNTDNLNEISNLTESTPGFLAGGLHEGKVYYHDGQQMYSVDAETQQITNLGILAPSWQWSDVASAPHYGPDEAYLFDNLIGFSNGGLYIELITPEDGTLRYFDLTSDENFMSDPFATICYAGAYADTRYPGYSYYVVRESGRVATLSVYTESEGASYGASISTDVYSYQTGIDMSGVATMGSGSYASSFYDAETGYVLMTQTAAGERTNLYAIDPNNGITALVGTFGEDIKLVNGLYMWERATDTTVRLDAETLDLYMDETYELEATVLPLGTDETVTFASSDEAIVTVDDNGVVSPANPGSASVTATTEALTAEGVPATDSVTVNTKALTPMSVKFNAQITDEEGNIFWGEIDTSTMTVTKISDAPTPITSGNWHDGKIYGTDGDYTSGGYIYEIDPANGYTGTQGAKYSASYVYVDGASAPLLVTDGRSSGYNYELFETCDFSVNLSNSGAVLLISDYTATSLTGFNLATQLRGATAIALAGEIIFKPTTSSTYLGYEYYILENDGDLHRMIIYPSYNTSTGAMKYSQRFTKNIANIGEVLTDKGEASMLFVDDGTNKGLLIAYSGNANTELYFVDMTSEYTDDETDTIVTHKIGTIAGVTDLAAIHIPTVMEEEVIETAGKMFTWTSSVTYRVSDREKANGLKDRWMIVDPDTLWYDTATKAYTGTTNYKQTFYNAKSGYVMAAEYVSGKVIFAHSNGYLYSAPVDDLTDITELLCWQDSMSKVNDMALNYQDGYLYILGPDGIFFKYNPSTNYLALDYVVSTVCPNSTTASYEYPTSFAINDEGVFYAVNNSAGTAKYQYLYTWTLSDVVETTLDGITTRAISELNPINTATDGYTGVIGKASCQMAWDHDADVLYIMGNSASTSTGNSGQHANAKLYTLDTTTGLATICTDYVPEGSEDVETGVSGLMYNYTRGLFVIPADGGANVPVPTDPPAGGSAETVNPAGQIVGWTNNAARQVLADKALGINTRWMAINPATVWYNQDTGAFAGTRNYVTTSYSKKVAAAVYVDGTVYFASEDGYLYSAPVSDLNSTTQLAKWSDVITSRINNSDYYVVDMAYNAMDGSVYLLNYANAANGIYKYDIAANTLALDYTVTITNPTTTKTTTDYTALRGMTIDDDGNFYAVSNSRMGSDAKFLYKWTASDVVETTAEDGTVTRAITALAPVNNTEDGGVACGTTAVATQLVWDSDKDVLYMFGGGSAWATTGEYRIYMYTIDTTTGLGSACTTAYPEGMTDVGTPGMIFNYVRGAFYVPASYTAPEPENPETVTPVTVNEDVTIEETVDANAAVTFDVTAEPAFVPGTAETASSVISLTTDISELVTEPVNQVGGSTNAVSVETVASKRADVSVDAAESTVTETGVELKLTETVDVNNGKIVVTYDPAELTYAGCTSSIGNTAVYADELSGTVTFAYASVEAVKAGEVIANISFAYAKDYVNTTVTTVVTERNDVTVTGESVTTGVTYEVGGHNYEVTDSREVTCTEDGYITYTCSKCGDNYTEELKAEGHKYESVVTGPTCTEMGYTTHTCSACGDSYVDTYVEAKGHSYESVVTEPSCTEMGYTTHTCSACGDSYVDGYVNPTGHSYEAVVTAPTCTAYGYTTYTCECGERYVSDYVAPTGHSFGEWESVTESGCETKGLQKRTCECGEVEYRDTDPTGHSYESVVTAPTCTEMGYTTYTCAVCGHSYKSDYVNPTGHSYEAVVTAPTCTEMGYTTYTCDCGESYKSDYVLPTGHSHEAVVTAPTCTEQGYTTYTCHCGDTYVSDYVDALGHSYGEWTVTEQETCTENGEETCVCAVCGDEMTRQIEAWCSAESYTDLDTAAWYHEGVCYVLRNGLMKGQAEGIFAPNAELNRAELVTVLYRMAGSPSVEGMENPFEDVGADTWFHDAVVWAASEGIVNGVSASHFAPGQAISREQIAAILYRYTKAEPVEEDMLSAYTDADTISAYAVDAMNWAVANGLISGMGNGILAPTGTANRAQIATILMRLCKL